MTKVTHIVEDIDNRASGVTTVVRDLHQQLLGTPIKSAIVSVTSGQQKNESEYQIYCAKGPWKYAKALAAGIRKDLASEEAILHTHGVWMYPQYIANHLARKYHRPYVITPHGMLEPWLFQGNLKYTIYLSLFQQENIRNASVLHAITPAERDNLFALTGSKNIEIIPNLISTSFLAKMALPARDVHREKYVLFLGRLHPKKGIDLLLRSFAELPDKNVILKIAGPMDDYSLTLKGLARQLGIESRVQFLGLVGGTEKFLLYRDAWVFVAPSYSEAMAMVNLEAGLMATPVITTFRSGLDLPCPDYGGLLINPNVEELHRALRDALDWSQAERDDRGKKLKDYIIANYSWEKNLNKWTELYSGLAS